MNRYRIHFSYSVNGRTRSKVKYVKARSFNKAVEKLEELMGCKVDILLIEVLGNEQEKRT